MTEVDLVSTVQSFCRALHLPCNHVNDPDHPDPAFPRLVIIGSGGVIWRGLKADTGRLRSHQRDWIDQLHAAGQNAAVWRPCHLTSGAIATHLYALAQVPTPDINRPAYYAQTYSPAFARRLGWPVPPCAADDTTVLPLVDEEES